MSDDPFDRLQSDTSDDLATFVSGYLGELPSAKAAAPEQRVDVVVGTGQGGWWSTIYPLEVSGSPDSDLAIRQGFLGGLSLSINSKKAARGSQRGSFLIPDTTTIDDRLGLAGLVSRSLTPATEVVLRSGRAGANPQVTVGSTVTPIGRRVEGFEWLWVGLPLVHMLWNILDGGALGVLAGGFAFLANVRLFVNNGASVLGRYLKSLAVMVGFLAASFALSLTIVLLLDASNATGSDTLPLNASSATGSDTIVGTVAMNSSSDMGSWNNCRGNGSFADVAPGTTVTIDDENGRRIGASSLESFSEAHAQELPTSHVLGDSPQHVVEFLKAEEGKLCVVGFRANVETAETYVIRIGNQAVEVWHRDWLDAEDWHIFEYFSDD